MKRRGEKNVGLEKNKNKEKKFTSLDTDGKKKILNIT